MIISNPLTFNVLYQLTISLNTVLWTVSFSRGFSWQMIPKYKRRQMIKLLDDLCRVMSALQLGHGGWSAIAWEGLLLCGHLVSLSFPRNGQRLSHFLATKLNQQSLNQSLLDRHNILILFLLKDQYNTNAYFISKTTRSTTHQPTKCLPN